MGILERKIKEIENIRTALDNDVKPFTDYLKNPNEDTETRPFVETLKDDSNKDVEDTRSAEYQFSLAKNLVDQYYQEIYGLILDISEQIPLIPQGYSNLLPLHEILLNLVNNFQEFYYVAQDGEAGKFSLKTSSLDDVVISQVVVRGPKSVAIIRNKLALLVKLLYKIYKEVAELSKNINPNLNDKGTKTLRWELSMFQGALYSYYKKLVLNYYNNHNLWVDNHPEALEQKKRVLRKKVKK